MAHGGDDGGDVGSGGGGDDGGDVGRCFVGVNNEGLSQYGSGNYTQAIKTYDKALAANPKYIVGLNNKGLALYGLGNYTEAIKFYDKALAINPKYIEGLNNKGLALYGLGNYTEAIKFYDKALAINATYVNSLNNKGNALAKLGKYVEANTYYMLATKLETAHHVAWSYIDPEYYIRILRVDDEITNQHANTRTLMTNQDPNTKILITNQGIVAKLSKKYDLAIVRFEFVLRNLDPNYFYAIWNEGDVYQQLGEHVEANIYFTKAMAINPISDYNGTLINTPAVDKGQGCGNNFFRCLPQHF